jgi:hypothetical protein
MKFYFGVLTRRVQKSASIAHCAPLSKDATPRIRSLFKIDNDD